MINLSKLAELRKKSLAQESPRSTKNSDSPPAKKSRTKEGEAPSGFGTLQLNPDGSSKRPLRLTQRQQSQAQKRQSPVSPTRDLKRCAWKLFSFNNCILENLRKFDHEMSERSLRFVDVPDVSNADRNRLVEGKEVTAVSAQPPAALLLSQEKPQTKNSTKCVPP
ncbi:uncharacterized protein LOC135933936 [Cloeon dipterum]|uniref:uncharacterized protein LOC135933936 n=1 Tax=Cloeon dipterum TaxID=197152 RepID=UPI0032200578